MKYDRLALERKLEKIRKRFFFKSFIVEDMEAELFIGGMACYIEKLKTVKLPFSLDDAYRAAKEFIKELETLFDRLIERRIKPSTSSLSEFKILQYYFVEYVENRRKYLPNNYSEIIEFFENIDVLEKLTRQVGPVYKTYFESVAKEGLIFSIENYDGKMPILFYLKTHQSNILEEDCLSLDGFKFKAEGLLESVLRWNPDLTFKYKPDCNFDLSTFVPEKKGVCIAQVAFVNDDLTALKSLKMYYYYAPKYIEVGEYYTFRAEGLSSHQKFLERETVVDGIRTTAFIPENEVVVAVISKAIYGDGDELPYDKDKLKRGHFVKKVSIRSVYAEDPDELLYGLEGQVLALIQKTKNNERK